MSQGSWPEKAVLFGYTPLCNVQEAIGLVVDVNVSSHEKASEQHSPGGGESGVHPSNPGGAGHSLWAQITSP